MKLTGLTTSEAAKRLLTNGANELPSQKRRGILTIFISVIRDPMLLLLVAAGALYLVIGEGRDAWMLMGFVVVVIAITFYQDRKTERALEALKKMASPVARVIRDGEEKVIPSRELVYGDIIFIREGDRIPADGTVVSATNLLVDESVLTGESVSVRKTVWNGFTKRIQPGGEDLPFVYSGTLVTQGHATVQVLETGIHTEVGKIGRSLQSIKEGEMLLKRETGALVKKFAIAGVGLSVIVAALYGFIHANWIAGILSGLTLSMALLPEEFSVVLVIFLALGAWRMSKHKVLVRKSAAIESLGAATVLCVDKTGTLTENKMELAGIWVDGKVYALADKASGNVLTYAMLASQRDPYDAVEKEIMKQAKVYCAKAMELYDPWIVAREYPLSEALFSVSHVWKSPDGKRLLVAAKGSPEAIADLCHMDAKKLTLLETAIRDLASRGYRIIGVAGVALEGEDTAKRQHDYPFTFAGLLLFHDGVRPSTAPALKECYTAGIRVIMITGDYAGTAQSVARDIGLKDPDRCMTGPELAKLTIEELRERIKTVNIFARVVPDQKLAIVDALKENGEIVAMTGDGVNDAPALKSAHIGIAMGERGTDVARETADIVLLKDDFHSIVEAVRMGRRIFANLRKAMMYIVAVHIPIAGMSLIPLLLGFPPVLLPAHIAFLELIIDPACSVVFESEEEDSDAMERPPRKLSEPLFGALALRASVMQSAGVLLAVLVTYVIAVRAGLGETDARTLAFVTIVLANILLIVTNLSDKENLFRIFVYKNAMLKWIIGGVLVALSMVLYIPFLRGIFHFSYLHTVDLLFAGAMVSASAIWLFVTKRLNRV